jgi:TonB-dependent receptor
VRGNAGVRFVKTDQTSRGFLATGAPIRSGQSYDEALPSLNLVAEVTDDVLIRLAASKSLTRPTLTQLSPGGRVSPTALTAVMGNPSLRPFTATQADIAAEWYFTEEALLSATLFRKKVASFITNVTTQGRINAGTQINDAGQDVSDAIYTITQPVNGSGGTVRGFELSLQTPFSFLPAPFDGLGMVANYTYADSSSTVLFKGETLKTLLPGQSRSSYNLVGYYEQGPFSIRAAYAWRDEYLDEVRAGGRERSNFTGSYGQLDLGTQYAVTENITLTADALNLLEEEARRYAQLKDRNVTFAETGRFFIIGARAKF